MGWVRALCVCQHTSRVERVQDPGCNKGLRIRKN